MDPVNRNYGQHYIYALWASVRVPPPPIWGHVQHSWMPDSPFRPDSPQSRRWPLFVYSEHNKRMAETAGFGRDQPVIAIGSPFLHLQALLSEGRVAAHDVPPPASESAIFYPRHADGRDEMVDHAQELQVHLRENLGRDLTVCLHFNDYSNPTLRDSYRRHGFRVITHGWGGNPQFLVAQYAELLRHGRVVSNMVTTPLWHGAALGLRVEVSGPEFNEPTDEDEFTTEHMAKRWPQLYDGRGLSGVEAITAARNELGWDAMRAPRELAQLLGWRGYRRLRSGMLDKPMRARRRLQDYDTARRRGLWA